MVAALVFATLAATPDAPSGRTPLSELEADERRLEDMPSMAPASVVLAFGGAVTLVGVTLAAFAVQRNNTPPPPAMGFLGGFGYSVGTALLNGFAIGFCIGGPIIELIGIGLLNWTFGRRENQEKQLRAVRLELELHRSE